MGTKGVENVSLEHTQSLHSDYASEQKIFYHKKINSSQEQKF